MRLMVSSKIFLLKLKKGSLFTPSSLIWNDAFSLSRISSHCCFIYVVDCSFRLLEKHLTMNQRLDNAVIGLVSLG